MKSYATLLFAISAVAAASHAETPFPQAGKPAGFASVLTAKDVRVVPFAQEHKEVKFKANTRELPSEMIVSTTDKIHVYGKRRTDGSTDVRGVPTGHIGKLALMPPGERKGTLALKKSFGSTLFFICLELPDDTLRSTQMALKEGNTYSWSVKTEGGRCTVRVLGADGTEVGTASAPTEKVLGVGFAATVRNIGNEVDMTIAFDR